jgi:hypothetical protein
MSDFFGITIRMYYDDHAPSHFHAYYAEHSAVIAIDSFDVVAGKLPRRAPALVREWPPAIATSCGRIGNWRRPISRSARSHRSIRLGETRLNLERSGMHRVTRVVALKNHRLHVEFSDGVEGEVSLAKRLFGPVFEPLKDPQQFAQVPIDEFGVICWPTGADVAPDTLHRKLAAKRRRAKTGSARARIAKRQ